MKRLMPQQCPVISLYLAWAVYLGGLVALLLRGDYATAAVWVVAFPLAVWAYVRAFPYLSQYLGYGRVDDVAPARARHTAAKVTMYGSVGCPFCPIVRRRLEELRERMGFELEHVDVTARPGLLTTRGIRSVPVIEVDGRRLVGNATSEQLAELIAPSR